MASRYNPAANTWAAVTGTGAPTARTSHSAVWTGSAMIVWGGFNGTNTFNNGGRYNPVTDTWSSVNTNGAPTTRSSHAAVWTGSEMIVWGGFNGTTNVNDGGRYSPATDSWTPLPTNAAPPLSISLTTTNTILLSWASPAIGHWLQQNSNLGTTNWTSVTNAPVVLNNQNQVVLSPAGGSAFFKLK